MLQNILKYALWVLFAVTAILVVMFYVQVVPLPEELAQMEHGTTDAILGWAVALFVICGLAALCFPIIEFVKQLISDPKSAIKTLVIIGAFAVVLLISYFCLASGSQDSICETLVETTPGELKWSDAGLRTLYISLFIAAAAVVYAEVAKKFN